MSERQGNDLTIGKLNLSYLKPLLALPTFLMTLFLHQLAGLFFPKKIHKKTKAKCVLSTLYYLYYCVLVIPVRAHSLFLIGQFEQILLLDELLWWVTHYCQKHAEALTSALEAERVLSDLRQCNEEANWRSKNVCFANRFLVFKAVRAGFFLIKAGILRFL